MLEVGSLKAAAKHIGGENDIPELRNSAGPLHDVLAQSQSLVNDEHARPPALDGFVESRVSEEFDAPFAVTNVQSLHRMLPCRNDAILCPRFRKGQLPTRCARRHFLDVMRH